MTDRDHLRASRGQSRHQERERALALLYEAEMKQIEPDALVAELPVAPGGYTATLVEGVGHERDGIDALLDRVVTGWSLERVAILDLLVMRIATFELLFQPEVPAAVVIDEAVELAKEFSTEESGRFVNGVLSAIAREQGRLDEPG